MITISESVNFVTCDFMERKTKKSLIKQLGLVIKKYNSRGFVISDVFADNEFDMEDLKNKILPSTLQLCAAGEHVSKVERVIRTVKDRCRTICHSLPYSSFPKLMSKGLVAHSVNWINTFTASGGVVGPYSPSYLLEGKQNPDLNKRRITFGSYAIVYSITDNTQTKRSIPCIVPEHKIGRDDGKRQQKQRYPYQC